MRSRIWTPPEKQIWTPEDPEVGAVPCVPWSPERMQCNTRGLALGLGLGLVFGGQTVNPLTIYGPSAVELWLRADLGITLNGGNVSAWADQSGSADNGGAGSHHAVQGTAGNQPLYVASDATFAGQACISFNKARPDVLASAVWTTAPTVVGTFFIVCNSDGAAATEVFCSFAEAGTGELYQNAAADVQYFQGSTLLFVGETTVAVPSVLGVDRNGAATNCYQNAITALNTGAAGSGALTKIIVAANTSAGAGPLGGKIAEIISINRIATLAERTATMRYLGARYNIAIAA